MKKLAFMSVVVLSVLASVSQASSSGCPLLRKQQTLHRDGTAVPVASRTSPSASPSSGGAVPVRR